MNRRLRRSLFALSLLALVAMTIAAASYRFVARDEGFYLYAARLVGEGKLPYRDFFFPQTPLSPYAYAGWFSVAGLGWVQARIFAALLTVAAGVLVFTAARRLVGVGSALAAIYVLALSVAVQVWLPTAQTDSVSVPLLTGAFAVLGMRGGAFWSGLLFSLAVDARLTLAPCGIALFYDMWVHERDRRRRNLSVFVGGGLVGLALLAAFALPDPHNFFAHNLRYHTERTVLTDAQASAQRWKVFVTLLGFRSGVGLGGWQFQLVLFSALAYELRRLKGGHAPTSLSLCGLLLFAVHLFPSPPYLQYFCLVVLFLAPAAAAAWEGLASVVSERIGRRVGQLVVPALVVSYGFLGLPDAHRFFVSGDRVIGVGSVNRSAWRIEAVQYVSRKVDEAAGNDALLISSWPGYAVATRAHLLPGLDSQFGPEWVKTAALSVEEQDRLKVMSRERALERFASGEAPIAVVFAGLGRVDDFESALVDAGGKRILSFRGIRMYGKQK